MALFVVERYRGNEATTKAEVNENHLAKLISKIEQRKKIKNQSSTNILNQTLDTSTNNQSVDTSHEHPVKKKKHELNQNIEINGLTSINTNEDAYNDHDHSVMQKKHKRKYKLDINCTAVTSVNENEEDDEGLENSVKLKKHKRKYKLDINCTAVTSVNENEDDDEGLENSVKLKKHKRKKELDENEELSFNDVTSTIEYKDSAEGQLLQTKETAKKLKKKKSKRESSITSIQENGKINVYSTEVSHISNDGEDTENNGTLNSLKESKSNFIIIGDHSFNKNKEVRHVLPQWLAKPSVISVNLKHLEADIHSIPYLNKLLVNKLQENKITHFFPVQSQLIPFLLKSERTRSSYAWPVDVCVSAPTGSGKTLAFVLPIIQTLLSRLITELRVVVILPVQDLASQVANVFRKYIKGTGLSVYLTVGGSPLHEEQQHLVKQRLDGTFESLIDILVTTPGRLVDHIYSTRGFTLKHLKFIVIDEADRVMDNFQNDWLYHLDNHLNVSGCPPLTVANLQTMPRRPQKLLFSATLSSDPEKLSELSLFQPRLFTSVVSSNTKGGVDGNKFIGKYTTPAELKEYMVLCEKTVKPLVLFCLIVREQWKHILVFASTTQNVHNLATLLNIFGHKMEYPVHVAEINATMPRPRRQQLIESFTAGQIDVLVSTDSLARGIDIPGVHYVINYDVPKFIKSYIHRVGRTGRAGQDGTAVSLLSHEQAERFTNLLKTAGKHEDIIELKVDVEELEEFEDLYKEALLSLKEISERKQKHQQEEKIMSSKMVIGKVKGTHLSTQKKRRLKKKKSKTS